MTQRNNESLRKTLEQLPTPRLDEMLHAELEKELPDGDTVRLLLKILRDREAGYPVQINSQMRKAWKTYQRKTARAGRGGKASLLKVASILLLCGLLLLGLPREATADSFFQRIHAWTDSFFQLFSREEEAKAYTFQTDNPGLQELYDTITELGVTVPAVPMWLDKPYELEYCKKIITPSNAKVTARFLYGEQETVIEFNIYSDNITREYHKNNTEAMKYENNGIAHYLFQNDTSWMIVWTRDNIECSIFIECQEESLYRILDSIYTLES